MKDLSNYFLISMPHLNDPIFSKSLIYICQHDKNGAMGIIINKPMQSKNSKEIIYKTGLEVINPIPEIYFGGPVDIEMGIFLHDCSYDIEGTLSISDTISLTSNKKIVSDIKNGNGPQKFKFLFGYAGWSEGQIEKEIENGDWLLMPSDDKFIFSISNSEKWERATLKFGIDISNLGGSAGLT